MYTETDALVKEVQNFLPQLDRIFLSNAISPEEAVKRIKKGEELLERLKKAENPGMRVTDAEELLETALGLAKAEVGDEEK